MHREDAIPLARESTGMRDVLLTMASGRLGCVGVVNSQGALVGTVTDGDYAAMSAGSENRTAADIMSRIPRSRIPASWRSKPWPT